MIVVAPATANDHPKRYEVVRDAKGQRIATVECGGITGECVIRDTKGKRTGTVDQEAVQQEPEEPTLEEVIEETRHRDPDGSW